MTEIEWTGEIGWDLWPDKISNDLASANGGDISIDFSSPGGDIMAGGDIYLLLMKYRRANPTAKMILNIKSVAASYGSLLASSPVWDEVTVEDISMAMYHNPANIVFGDFRKMQENAIFLEEARGMYTGIYSTRSGKTVPDVEAMMDKTTWLMGGAAIVEAGFADRVMSTENNESMSMSMHAEKAKMAYTASTKRMKELAESGQADFDYERAVACMSSITENVIIETPGKPDEIKTVPDSGTEITEESKVKDKTELMAELPEVYNESVNDGVIQERARVKELSEMKAQEEYKDIPEVVEAIDKAILNGNSVVEANTLMNAAMVKVFSNPARMASVESPGMIAGGSATVTETKERITEV